MVRPPTGMVLIAGEQLMPNVKAILRAVRRSNLRMVVIVVSGHVQSKSAGQKLLQLIAQINRGEIKGFGAEQEIEARVLEEEDIDKKPEDLSPRLVELIRSTGSVERWLVNFTGGNKIMFFALLTTLRPWVADWIYLEIGQDEWYRYRISTEGPLKVTTEKLERDNYADQVPAVQLLSAISSHNLSGAPAPDYDYNLLSKRLATNHWDFPAAWRECGHPAKINQDADRGYLFEEFVASCLKGLGIDNVSINIKMSGTTGQAVQEVDIACIYNGRFLLLDVKSGKDSLTPSERIRVASISARNLAGSAAQAVLIHPQLYYSKEMREWAKLLNVRIFDRSNRSRLADFLAQLVGVRNVFAVNDDFLAAAHLAGYAMPSASAFQVLKHNTKNTRASAVPKYIGKKLKSAVTIVHSDILRGKSDLIRLGKTCLASKPIGNARKIFRDLFLVNPRDLHNSVEHWLDYHACDDCLIAVGRHLLFARRSSASEKFPDRYAKFAPTALHRKEPIHGFWLFILNGDHKEIAHAWIAEHYGESVASKVLA